MVEKQGCEILTNKKFQQLLDHNSPRAARLKRDKILPQLFPFPPFKTAVQ